MSDRSEGRRAVSRWLLALLFIAAGILHFVYLPMYAHIIPAFLPAHNALVIVSGICEILGGVGALLPPVRRPAGIGLIALLIAVFPANINMLVQQVQAHGWNVGAWLLLLRLPLQFLLIAWVYHATLVARQERLPG